MSELQDHPDIASALATGYPRGHREPPVLHCADCGCELVGTDRACDYDGDKLCHSCFKKRVCEEVDFDDLAKALGYIVKPASEFAEDDEEDYL